MELQILQRIAGRSDNFSYLVFCPETRRGMAVDPACDPDGLLSLAREQEVTIEIVANTHGHLDHISGNDTLLAATGAKLAAHPDDVPQADIPLQEGSSIPVGDGMVEVLHTPGHTPGGVVFRLPDAIVTGDTLFVSRCGRADLAGSDVRMLYRSLQRLKALPPETKVYPGHNYGPQPVSTIGWEQGNNEFLRCADVDSFIRLRMG